MSASPTRYYASRSSSRAGSRPTSPENPSEVRSQAIAKLKRAASLPRTPAGQRPPIKNRDGHSTATSTEAIQERSVEPGRTDPIGDQGHWDSHDAQEILSPSPIARTFDHANMYASTPGMQRSGSSSSSYHIPTPPQFTSGQSMGGGQYYLPTSAPSGTPDWAAMQLAHSYLPSLSPVGMPPSPMMPQGPPEMGRHTPSPLPTLGELRTLQRSNSAAARAQAMSKLTGGRDTPSESSRAPTPLVTAMTGGASLHRAGTVGAPRFMGIERPKEESVMVSPKADDHPTISEPKPRLQRSFTVSSSNMGEERRSAVGRRMVERLAERRAARQKEEEEVRKLWEERRGTAHSVEYAIEDDSETGGDDVDQDDGVQNQELGGDPPALRRISPIEPAHPFNRNPGASDFLQLPDRDQDRPISRVTMKSTDEPFQYESHLSRSLSGRTARNVSVSISGNGETSQPHTPDGTDTPSHTQDSSLQDTLMLPNPVYATPTRHGPLGSTSMHTLQESVSPGDSIMSRDALGSMMFVMGGGSTSGQVSGVRPFEHNWPSEVEENGGSEWGSPLRDLQPATPHDLYVDDGRFSDPRISVAPEVPPKDFPITREISHSTTSTETTPSPPINIPRQSVMSWEEVGGADDRSVPSDAQYHKKSGSMSAKLGRNFQKAFKKSHTRSSASSSTNGEPMSPSSLTVGVQNFGKRGSEGSLSPSSANTVNTIPRGSPNGLAPQQVRHQPSVSSLSPSLPSQTESSANSALLQYQLSENPSQSSFMPRADLNDPRIHHSKLSPFPGFTNLERKANAMAASDAPRLVHQASDSAMATSARPQVDKSHQDSITSLPVDPAEKEHARRGSDDSISKRSWLARAFSSPRSSTRMSRQGSIIRSLASPETTPPKESPQNIISPQTGSQFDADPFAAPPAPVIRPANQRSASPSVSVVPEVSEEGSRLTRFTMGTNRLDNNTPKIEEQEEKIIEQSTSKENTEEASRSDGSWTRLDALKKMLALNGDDPDRPEILDDPPRKLLLAHQVLQVVNQHTAKDRYIFLFNDILVIAKPLLKETMEASLDVDFVVKSVIPLDKVEISGFADIPSSTERSPTTMKFIEAFSRDPIEACRSLVARGENSLNATTLANLIHTTPELDRNQIGVLLASDHRLLGAFVDKLVLPGTRIDVGLRSFLLAVALPADVKAQQNLLRAFAKAYFENNKDTISFSRETAVELVLAMIDLDNSIKEAAPGSISALSFTSSFRTKDTHKLVPLNLLEEIYTSIKVDPLAYALVPEEEVEQGISVILDPHMPTRLTLNTWSADTWIEIPDTDARFAVALSGVALEFDPPILDFSASRRASFRFRGAALGPKSIIFQRIGPNAALYSNLANLRNVSIERAFMRHTFQLTFPTSSGQNRKLCCSFSDANTYTRWANHLPKLVSAAGSAKAISHSNPKLRIRQALDAMSLHVLKRTLLGSSSAPTVGQPAMNGNLQVNPRIAPPPRTRSGSISVVYGRQQGKYEDGLTPPGSATQSSFSGLDTSPSGAPVFTGKELVLVCRQNSLLPGLMDVLQPTNPVSRVGVRQEVIREAQKVSAANHFNSLPNLNTPGSRHVPSRSATPHFTTGSRSGTPLQHPSSRSGTPLSGNMIGSILKRGNSERTRMGGSRI